MGEEGKEKGTQWAGQGADWQVLATVGGFGAGPAGDSRALSFETNVKRLGRAGGPGGVGGHPFQADWRRHKERVERMTSGMLQVTWWGRAGGVEDWTPETWNAWVGTGLRPRLA